MRKWFWCCTAASVLAASFYGTVKYCGTHSDASVVKAVASACALGLRTPPLSGIHSVSPGTEAGLPEGAADPVACNEKRVSNQTVIQVELPGNIRMDPAPIVIREDEDLKEPVAIVHNAAGNELFVVGGEVVEWQAQPVETPGQHKMMPYAEEDEHHASMPYAEEECETTINVGNLFGTGLNGPSQFVLAEQTAPELSLWRRFVLAIQGAGATAGATEESEPKEEAVPLREGRALPYYTHDHDAVCPYSGHSSTSQPYSPRLVPVEEPKTEPKQGGQEESETVKPMKLDSAVNPMHFFDDNRELLQSRPAYPRIDTMEFRPSDHKLNEYGQLPGTL